MKIKFIPMAILFGLISMLTAASSFAQETQPIKVTPETYIRAESDRQFGGIVKMAGGLNKFFHFRNPTPLHSTSRTS